MIVHKKRYFILLHLLIALLVYFMLSKTVFSNEKGFDFQGAYTSIPEADSTTRGMFIFLDDSEMIPGAITQSLVVALHQKPGPLVVSINLLTYLLRAKTPSTVLSLKNRAFYAQRFKDLSKKFRDAWPASPASDDIEGELNDVKYIALTAARFNKTEWVIKKVNDGLCLLIPTAFLRKMSMRKEAVEETVASTAAPTKTECALGLKVNHMQLLDIHGIATRDISNYTQAHYFVDALWNDVTKCSSLLCTNADYNNKSVHLVPSWSFFMIGHGMRDGIIAGLSIQNFKKVLYVFKHHVSTQLFFYSSCYAAGMNIENVYKEGHLQLQTTYPFAIITAALTDAVVWLPVIDIDCLGGDLVLKSQYNFVDFLHETSMRPINYERAVTTIMPVAPDIKKRGELLDNRLASTPQIKLPGVEWFSVLAGHTMIVSIGKILAQTRDFNKALNIAHFFKTDPRIILLYAEIIPFELIINGNNIDAIVSMAPGNSFNSIHAISSSIHTVDTICRWFTEIDMLDCKKEFFIQEIKGCDRMIKDVVIICQKDEFENYRYTITYTASDGVVYQKSNKGFLYKKENEVQTKADPFASLWYALHRDRVASIIQRRTFVEKKSIELKKNPYTGATHVPCVAQDVIIKDRSASARDSFFKRLHTELEDLDRRTQKARSVGKDVAIKHAHKPANNSFFKTLYSDLKNVMVQIRRIFFGN